MDDYLVYDKNSKIVYVLRDLNKCIINSLGNQIDIFIKTYNELSSLKKPLYYDEMAKRINQLINIYNSLDKNNNFNIKSYMQMADYEFFILK